MRNVAVSMHNTSFAESRHFCLEANAAQERIRFQDILLRKPERRLFQGEELDAEDACMRASSLKVKHRLKSDDLLVVVVDANLGDHENDEYFFVSNLDYPAIKARCPAVGILSLYYLNPRSTFMKDGEDEWRKMTSSQKKWAISNSILLNLLGSITEQVARVPTHDVSHQCVMDYCQIPFHIMRALDSGFRFCDEECRPKLAKRPYGSALLAIANRLTARPFRGRLPSIFLSYAREDQGSAERLYADLTGRGFNVFKDTHALLPGVLWEREIKKSLATCDFVISCLSTNALKKKGYFQYELKEAIRLQKLRTASGVFLIPVRFDTCKPPRDIKKQNWVDLYLEWGKGVDNLAATIARYPKE